MLEEISCQAMLSDDEDLLTPVKMLEDLEDLPVGNGLFDDEDDPF